MSSAPRHLLEPNEYAFIRRAQRRSGARPRKQARLVKRVELNRWPTTYGDCIRSLGLREGFEHGEWQGGFQGLGVNYVKARATRAEGGAGGIRGDTHRRPSAHGGSARDGRTHRVSRTGGRKVARPEDDREAQAPRATHRALGDVHARHAAQERGHALRDELSRTTGVEGSVRPALNRTPTRPLPRAEGEGAETIVTVCAASRTKRRDPKTRGWAGARWGWPCLPGCQETSPYWSLPWRQA